MTDRNNTIFFDDGDALISANRHDVRIDATSGEGVLIRIEDGEGDIRSAISEIAKSLVMTVPVPDGYEEIDPMLATVDDYFQINDPDGQHNLYRIRSIDSDGDIYVEGIGYAWNRRFKTNRNQRLESSPWRVVRRIASSNGSSAKTERPAPIRMVELGEAEPGDIAMWKPSRNHISIGILSEEDGQLVVSEGDLIQGSIPTPTNKWVVRCSNGTSGGSMDWFVILRLNVGGHRPSDFLEPTDRCTHYWTATGGRLYLDSCGGWSVSGGGSLNGKSRFSWSDILREFGPEEFPLTIA